MLMLLLQERPQVDLEEQQQKRTWHQRQLLFSDTSFCQE
jgi:hypothetical protein